MEREKQTAETQAEKRGLERFWKLWAEGVEIIENNEGAIQERVRMAWQQALGLIEMREVPESVYEQFVQLKKEYVDFHISTGEFRVPDSFITETAAQKHANRVVELFNEHSPIRRDGTDGS